MTPIHIQWSDNGQHIRKWGTVPFDGSERFERKPDVPVYPGTEPSEDQIAIGEATLAASRAADPNAAPEGTRDALATCATMLETYMPECLPANEHGQVAFMRCMTDATVAEIRAFLANEEKVG